MERIHTLLEKYQRLAPPDNVLKQHICDVLKAHYAVNIETAGVRVSRRVVYLTVDATTRNTLHIHKDRIVEMINTTLGRRMIYDLR